MSPEEAFAAEFAAAVEMWRYSAFIPEHPGEGDLDLGMAGDAMITINDILDRYNAHRAGGERQ